MRRYSAVRVVRTPLALLQRAILFLAASWLCHAAAIRSAGAQPLFPNPVYPVGSNPYGMVKADFTGDGIEDLIVANFADGYSPGPGDLSLLRGNGDGTFADEVRISISQHPFSILTADFNGDGRSDLVVDYADSAVLMAGQGNGTFGPESTLTAGGLIRGTSLAYINRDAVPDLLAVVTVSGSNYVQALIGNGRGGFTPGPLSAPGRSLSAVADVNGDGLDDYLQVTDTFQSCDVPTPPAKQVNDILIFLGQGDGTFISGGRFSTGDWTYGVIPADLDGDGKIDLVVNGAVFAGCGGYSGRWIYYGNGDGTFVAAGPIEIGSYTSVVLAGDLNHDGFGDYVDINHDSIGIFLGHGDRTFAALPPFYAGSTLVNIERGDFDRDGKADLAILSNWGEAVFIFAGNGDGTFGPARIPSLEAASLNTSSAADLNGDGVVDLVAADSLSTDLTVVLGRSDGSFGPESHYPVGVGSQALSLADFNGDGKKDIAVTLLNWALYPPTVFPTGSLAILLGNGDGTFQPVSTYDTGQTPLALVIGDVNEDGAQDVVTANWGGGFFGADGDLSLFLGRGDGTMSPQIHIPVGVRHDPIYDSTTPVSLAFGDFNQDGHRDLVVGMRGTYNSPATGEVEILYGNGDGTFRPETAVLQVTSAEGVAVGDLNRDGHDDIAVANPDSQVSYAPGGLYVLLGGGDGTFTTSGPLAAGVGPYDIRIDDFNSDGIPDLAATNNGGYLALLPGLGDGTFGPRLNFGLFGVPLSIVEGDFNGDGRPDLMVFSSNGAFIFSNQSIPPLSVDATVSTTSPVGKGSGTVSWVTSSEWDLAGFNVLEIDNHGQKQLNSVLIGCKECATGLGGRYTYPLAKHKSGRNIYIEAVHQSGRKEIFGPARKQ